MIKVSILGVTGYSGEELLRILISHPQANIVYATSNESRDSKLQDIYPYLKGKIDLPCSTDPLDDDCLDADVIFLALPHSVSMKYAPQLMDQGKTVIDLSADYRLGSQEVYPDVYGYEHLDNKGLDKAVYGLTEFNRQEIQGAQLIANPGCYPTGALLGLLPLIESKAIGKEHCIIDAKSGVTGAGRKASKTLLFPEVDDNFKAYKVLKHAHQEEIQFMLKSKQVKNGVIFVPHLLPVRRGILSTMYLPINTSKIKSQEDLHQVFYKRYQDESFIHVLPLTQFPELKDVEKTNQCHIGVGLRKDEGVAIVVTAIDNLQKGASGQAVQNMNVVMGFEEHLGLI